MVWEMLLEEFQDGHHDGHPGYRNGTILAILNLYVTVMPPIKFRSIRLTVWEEMPLNNVKIAATAANLHIKMK